VYKDCDGVCAAKDVKKKTLRRKNDIEKYDIRENGFDLAMVLKLWGKIVEDLCGFIRENY
jgi:Fic family protein